MVGFYLLALRIYKSKFMAYAGYLMLLFSALGTRLFDSYLMLVAVPVIWFFYFLVAFSQTPTRYFFLGLCLSLMISAGTYIPFYFILFFIIFMIVFVTVYFKYIAAWVHSYLVFFKRNKVLVILSLALVLLSFAPSIQFFHESSKGGIVLPSRHGDSSTTQIFSVPHGLEDWDITQDWLNSWCAPSLKQYNFGFIYVPFFAVIVFAFGLVCSVNRRIVTMFLCGFILVCAMTSHGLPFYDFLRKHLFFVKFFRNLFFFNWIILIPLFVLLVLEHWNMFLKFREGEAWRKKMMVVYVVLVHGVLFFIVQSKGALILSTYAMFVLSLMFWVLLIYGHLNYDPWKFALLTLVIIVQPLEVYHYLLLSSPPYQKCNYTYEFPCNSLDFAYKTAPHPLKHADKYTNIYFATSQYNALTQNIDEDALTEYLKNKFILVEFINFY